METILEVRNLKKTFWNDKQLFTAVNGISFSMEKGQCLGLVGESGCGKSTTAKMIVHLLKPDEGEIYLCNKPVHQLTAKQVKGLYRDVQMVFQTPQDSFDPRRTLGDGIMESLLNQSMKKPEAKKRMNTLLQLVELEGKIANRYPHQVSGGQCQRAAIARALAIEPELIVCDEATSALDVTVQAQVIDLLKKLQDKLHLSILLISHDLALVQHLCDHVLVMNQGQIVEAGTPDQIIQNPKEEYTKILVDSVF